MRLAIQKTPPGTNNGGVSVVVPNGQRAFLDVVFSYAGQNRGLRWQPQGQRVQSDEQTQAQPSGATKLIPQSFDESEAGEAQVRVDQ